MAVCAAVIKSAAKVAAARANRNGHGRRCNGVPKGPQGQSYSVDVIKGSVPESMRSTSGARNALKKSAKAAKRSARTAARARACDAAQGQHVAQDAVDRADADLAAAPAGGSSGGELHDVPPPAGPPAFSDSGAGRSAETDDDAPDDTEALLANIGSKAGARLKRKRAAGQGSGSGRDGRKKRKRLT